MGYYCGKPRHVFWEGLWWALNFGLETPLNTQSSAGHSVDVWKIGMLRVVQMRRTDLEPSEGSLRVFQSHLMFRIIICGSSQLGL